MVMVTLDEEVLDGLRLTAKELATAQQRTVRDVTRRLRTQVQRSVVQKTGIRPASAKRRILAFPPRGKLWLGANEVPARALRSTKLVREGRNSGRRRVSIMGELVPNAVAVAPDYLPLVGVPGGGLTRLRVDLRESFQQAFREVERTAPELAATEFRKRAEGVVRGRRDAS